MIESITAQYQNYGDLIQIIQRSNLLWSLICPGNYTKQQKITCTVKETINKMKRKPIKWKKIFANHMSDKELVCKIYSEKYIAIAKI